MARPASDIRLRIVRAARDCFLVDGVEGASLRAIARAAGTNLGMVYYYHPTKDDLFLAVVEEVYGKLLADMERLLGEQQEATAALVDALYQRLAAMTDDEHKVMRLVVREALSSDPARIARLFERFSRGHLPLFAKLIHGGIRSGELRADIPPIAMVVTTLVVGLMPQLMRQRFADAELAVDALLPAPPELARALCRILLAGIRAEGPSSDLR